MVGIDHPTFFIADIAANHDGDLARAKDLIYLAKEAGADAAKFQHFSAKTIVSDFGFKAMGNQKSHQTSWKKSVFDTYKDASLSTDWSQELKDTCDDAGIVYFTSPYSFELVDHVEPFVAAFKIGSGDITWTEIIEHISKKRKPTILASGASNIEDVVRAVDAALKHNPNFALLQCNTNYTGDIQNLKYVNLNVLQTYKTLFPDMVIGLSDHTPGHATVVGSIALGARIIEKHFTDDVTREGPDHTFSMDPKSWGEMVKVSRELEAALGSTLKRVEDNEKETVVLQQRSICVARNLDEGHQISEEDITFLRPCPKKSLKPYQKSEVIGRTLKNSMPKGSPIYPKDLV